MRKENTPTKKLTIWYARTYCKLNNEVFMIHDADVFSTYVYKELG